MNETLPKKPAPAPSRDWGRFVGGLIFLVIGGGFVTIAACRSRKDIQKAWEAIEWSKLVWCFGFACVGFAFNAFKASGRVGRKVKAWPLYARLYFPLLVLISFFVYCAVEVYTADRTYFFFGVSAPLALALGWHADQLAREPMKLFPGKPD